MGQRLLFTQAYHYDRLLRLLALTNQNGDRWQFRYDGGGRLIEATGSTGVAVAPEQDARAPTQRVYLDTTTPL